MDCIIIAKVQATPPGNFLGNKPSITVILAKVGFETMPPRRTRTQPTPSSPDPEDVRFPSEAKTT
jgi:hypothetical protein